MGSYIKSDRLVFKCKLKKPRMFLRSGAMQVVLGYLLNVNK